MTEISHAFIRTRAHACPQRISEGSIVYDRIPWAQNESWVPYSGLGVLLSLRTFGGPSRCPFFLLSPCNFGLLGRGLLGGANMDGMKAVIESSAPLHFWGEVILTTCHVLNRMPHKNSRTTPFEMWKWHKQNFGIFESMGLSCLCKAY